MTTKVFCDPFDGRWKAADAEDRFMGFTVSGLAFTLDHADRLQIGPRHGFSKRLWSRHDEVLPSL